MAHIEITNNFSKLMRENNTNRNITINNYPLMRLIKFVFLRK